MDNTKLTTSIHIGNKGKDVKKAFFLITVLSFIFTSMITTGLSKMFSLQLWEMLFLGLLVFLVSSLLWASFLSMYIRYFEITEDEFILADSTQFKKEFQMLSNAIFHTRFEVETIRISLDTIASIKLIAFEDIRTTRLTGYDGNVEKGYRVWICLCLLDDSEISIKDWFYYKDPEFLKALNFLQRKGVKIIDKQHLCEVIRRDLPLADFLNGKLSL